MTASYHAIHSVMTNPVYAGAYTYGKTKQECVIDETGQIKKRTKRLPQSQWAVLIHDHHKGFIDWKTYEMNQARIAKNTRPVPHKTTGAIREGAALLQGLATCGKCGRRLKVYYQGKNSSPGYYCAANNIVEGRAKHCMRVGGVKIDNVVANAFLNAITPAAMDAILLAEKNIETEHDAALDQWRLQIERLQYEADKAERRFQAVDPENRLVARTLEKQWETCLHQLQTAKNEFEQSQKQRPEALTPEQRDHIHNLSKDIKQIWQAPTTTYRDKKELLQILLQEVNISVNRTLNTAHLIIRWQTNAVTEIDMDLPKRNSPTIRTEQNTIDLVRRLAVHYKDAMIAGILNRQGRQTARGHRFTANRVGNLRRHWNIPKFDPASVPPDEGELVTVQKAAEILQVASGTVHRWLLDGFIPGEQITPGAPWRIRMTEELKSNFVQQPPEGYVTMKEAKRILGVSRQTVLHRVKSGRLSAVHVRKGKQMGLYIKVIDKQMSLFD